MNAEAIPFIVIKWIYEALYAEWMDIDVFERRLYFYSIFFGAGNMAVCMDEVFMSLPSVSILLEISKVSDSFNYLLSMNSWKDMRNIVLWF